MSDDKSDLDLIQEVPPVVEDALPEEKEEVDETAEESKEKVEEKELSIEEIDALPYNRPSFKEVATKYPQFFKDFPDLKHAFFREPEYTKIYPTIEDAKEASTKAEDYDALVSQIGEGKLNEIFTEMEKPVLEKTAYTFLPSLYKHDQDMYFTAINPVLDQFLKSAHKEGEANNNEDLQNAAEWLSHWFFGDVSFAKGERVVPRPAALKTPTADETKLKEEKRTFYDTKFVELKSSVVSDIKQEMSAHISSGLKDVTNAKLRAAIATEVMEQVGETLQSDAIHMKQINLLWGRAEGAGYPLDYKARITNVYLARAKALIPALRAKIKAEYLGTTTNKEDTHNEPLPPSGGAPVSIGNKIPSARQVNWDQTSDLDFIRGKATMRR